MARIILRMKLRKRSNPSLQNSQQSMSTAFIVQASKKLCTPLFAYFDTTCHALVPRCGQDFHFSRSSGLTALALEKIRPARSVHTMAMEHSSGCLSKSLPAYPTARLVIPRARDHGLSRRVPALCVCFLPVLAFPSCMASTRPITAFARLRERRDTPAKSHGGRERTWAAPLAPDRTSPWPRGVHYRVHVRSGSSALQRCLQSRWPSGPRRRLQVPFLFGGREFEPRFRYEIS